MEQAKPHYQSCWPSIVHAASLWLNNGGFESIKHDMQEGICLVFMFKRNRPFAGSGHMIRNKLRWDANDAVGLPKQRKVGLDWYEFIPYHVTRSCKGSIIIILGKRSPP